MRLLERKSDGDLVSHEYTDNDVPAYAILSHNWLTNNKEEVSFQDIEAGTGKSKAGWEKIQFCADKTAADNLRYFWIDTCCIDKKDAVELAAAINSMFRWYQNAARCYVYLWDVPKLDTRRHDQSVWEEIFKKSRWFTRGWTLQELIAPKEVVFYSYDWQALGTKGELKNIIHKITGISIQALEGASLESFSVAERMSWASKRMTTREEDIAYCLLGIFNVNISLVYGERDKAFLRLQQEIMRDCNDQSIFAWKDSSLQSEKHLGLLARSPSQFQDSGNLQSLRFWARHGPFEFTNNGLRIELWLIPTEDEKIFLASLPCSVGPTHHRSPAIYVKRVSGFNDAWGSSQRSQFVRIRGDQLREVKSEDKIHGGHRVVFVRQNPGAIHSYRSWPQNMVIFQVGWEWGSCTEVIEQCSDVQVFPLTSWDPQTGTLIADREAETLGAVFIKHKATSTLTLFGLTSSGEPWVQILSGSSLNLEQWTSYQHTGTEKKTCQVVIDESGPKKISCTSTIWEKADAEVGRQTFVVFIEGNLESPALPLLSEGRGEWSGNGWGGRYSCQPWDPYS